MRNTITNPTLETKAFLEFGRVKQDMLLSVINTGSVTADQRDKYEDCRRILGQRDISTPSFEDTLEHLHSYANTYHRTNGRRIDLSPYDVGATVVFIEHDE
ncbi:hypothetical protein ACFLZX_00125 [Nanoarchaeota archaeon]